MANQLIELKDGVLVEIEAPKDQGKQISSRLADRVKTTLDDIKPLLRNVCKPISEVFDELDKNVAIETVEVEVSFGFEAEGNIYVTKAKANSNLTVKLTLKPKS